MTSVSNNVCIDKLDDIGNKYNNTYHSTIKMKPIDVTSSTYFDFGIENNNQDPKFKVCDDQNIKLFLQKVTLEIGVKKFF